MINCLSVNKASILWRKGQVRTHWHFWVFLSSFFQEFDLQNPSKYVVFTDTSDFTDCNHVSTLKVPMSRYCDKYIVTTSRYLDILVGWLISQFKRFYCVSSDLSLGFVIYNCYFYINRQLYSVLIKNWERSDLSSELS